MYIIPIGIEIILIGGLEPLNLVLFIFLLQLVIFFNLTSKKSHIEFWGTFGAVVHYM